MVQRTLVCLIFTTPTTGWHAAALSPRYRKSPLPARLVPTETLQAVSTDTAASTNEAFPFVPPIDHDETQNMDKDATLQHGGPLSQELLHFPRHSHSGVNEILTETEQLIRRMHVNSKTVDARQVAHGRRKPSNSLGDMIFANTYVDLGKVDTVG